MDEVLAAADRDKLIAGLESPRLQFFLKHQVQIRTWQALAREAWDEVESALQGLGIELTSLGVGEFGFEVGRAVAGRPMQGVVLFDRDWLRGNESQPAVGVAIGWDSRPNPGRSWPNSSLPYVGLLTAKTEDGIVLKAALGPLIDARLARGGLEVAGFVTGTDWSAFQRFEKTDGWWRDVPKWRADIASRLLAAARTWHPVVADAVLRLR